MKKHTPKAKAAEVEIEMDGASFHLGNCTLQDAQWFGELCKLFADPHDRSSLDAFRRGELFIGRHPVTGRLMKAHSFGAQHINN